MIAFNQSAPQFSVGEGVCHRRYGYRGVVVAVDRQCNASDEWYHSNRSKPDRNQAWYHVLVHGHAHATYAAESNLEVDPSPQPVANPGVDQFFDGFDGERHLRNDEPWQGW